MHPFLSAPDDFSMTPEEQEHLVDHDIESDDFVNNFADDYFEAIVAEQSHLKR
jgi:hypothetical protein